MEAKNGNTRPQTDTLSQIIESNQQFSASLFWYSKPALQYVKRTFFGYCLDSF